MARTERVSVPRPAAGEPPMAAYLAPPDGAGPFPGVVVIHEVFGLNENVRYIARRCAGKGYVALAVDLFSGEQPRAVLRTRYGPAVRRDLPSCGCSTRWPSSDHLGFCVSAPFEAQRHLHRLAEEFGAAPIAELVDLLDRAPASVAGVVTALRVRTTRKGQRMAWLTLADRVVVGGLLTARNDEGAHEPSTQHTRTTLRRGRRDARRLSERHPAIRRDPGKQTVRFANGLKVHNRIFAKLVGHTASAAVDAPAAAGDGVRFDPDHGQLMQEWLAADPRSEVDWLALARQAMGFVGSRPCVRRQLVADVLAEPRFDTALRGETSPGKP